MKSPCNKSHLGISTPMTAIIVILIIIIAGLGVYSVSLTGKSGGSTTTLFSTTTVGAGATVTVNSGTTLTSTVTASGTGSSGVTTSPDLVAACKAEGATVTVYTVFGVAAWPVLQPYIHDTFPWLTVNPVALSPGGLVTRAQTEFQAGKVTADVYQDTFSDLVELNQSGMVQPFTNYIPQFENQSAVNIDPNGYWYQVTYDPILVIYNTNLVTGSNIPTSYTDLANPQWNNKIALDNPALLNVAGLLFASMASGMTNSSWTTFLKGVAANHPILGSSAGQSNTAVVSGEAAIGITLFDNYASDLQTHAPVAAAPINPIYVLTAPAGLAKDAPHPACGELLIQWFSSYAGQTALGFTNRPPSIPYLTGTYLAASGLPSSSSYIPGATGEPSYFTDTSGWAGYYSNIFGAP